ncbi:MAG: RloB family protein [Ignavibacteria bacterium]
MRNISITHHYKKYLLILCEDKKSSRLYFDSFKKNDQFRRELKVTYTVEHPEDYSPLGLVNAAIHRRTKAIEEKNPYDEIWVVFDKDKHKNIPNAYSLAEKENINIAISIICFEYWVLLHFKNSTKPFNKCDELIKHIKKNYYSDYEKCSNCFDNLKDKISLAIKNAELVERSVKNEINRRQKIYELNAYTNIHHLVKKLIPKKFY